MSSSPNPSSDRQRVSALLEQLKALESSSAGTSGYAQRAKRSEILDELQDAVGLSGKMVTDDDILKGAARFLTQSGA